MYVAPEALSGELVGPLADQYSLATIAYFLLTGCLPFPAKTPREMFSQLLSQPPIPLNQAKPGLRFPPAVEEVVMRGLSKEPSKRYPDVVAFAAEFSDALAAARTRKTTTTACSRKIEVAVPKKVALDRVQTAPAAAATRESGRLGIEIGRMHRQPERERRAFAELALDGRCRRRGAARDVARWRGRGRCRAASSRRADRRSPARTRRRCAPDRPARCRRRCR